MSPRARFVGRSPLLPPSSVRWGYYEVLMETQVAPPLFPHLGSHSFKSATTVRRSFLITPEWESSHPSLRQKPRPRRPSTSKHLKYFWTNGCIFAVPSSSTRACSKRQRQSRPSCRKSAMRCYSVLFNVNLAVCVFPLKPRLWTVTSRSICTRRDPRRCRIK